MCIVAFSEARNAYSGQNWIGITGAGILICWDEEAKSREKRCFLFNKHEVPGNLITFGLQACTLSDRFGG